MATLQSLTQADLDYVSDLLTQGNISGGYDFLSGKELRDQVLFRAF